MSWEQVTSCPLSGLRFDKRLLNASGEFNALREVLDGMRAGKPLPDQGFLARACPDVFRGSRGCDYVTAKSKTAYILFGERSFLGFKKRVFAVIADGEMSGMTLIGKAIFGKRVQRVWVVTDIRDVASRRADRRKQVGG